MGIVIFDLSNNVPISGQASASVIVVLSLAVLDYLRPTQWFYLKGSVTTEESV